ncbi:MAG: M48 family metalloprotease, partial [Granulosicoccus sp.]|nr:M48 family metalloprotease [Granulosicoccus sp.]
MDFFSQQSIRKRHSLFILVGFVMAMLAIALIIQISVAGFSMFLGESKSIWIPSTQAIVMVGIVWLTLLAGSFFRALDVRAGGAVLARRLGAVHASNRARHDKEKVLLNVVAEVSIASGTVQPEVYVLRNESSINAFVLGNASNRNVIVVTNGALEAFDRDQLQAVVAHEFGHIANGDLPLNMRLLVALGGLMAIDEVGRWLYSKGPGNNFHPGIIVGALLIGIGSVGVFAGKLIRAAFSRQREFLADASAVQFTRNPLALASALGTIKSRDDEPALHSPHMQELVHLCFRMGITRKWFYKLLNTHPSLQDRIDAIDPHYAVKQRKERDRQANNSELSGSAMQGMLSAGDSDLAGHNDQISSTILSDCEDHIVPSDRIFLLLGDQTSWLAALFAVFANSDPIKHTAYLNTIAFSFDQQFAAKVKDVLRLLPDEFKHEKVSVITHVTDNLRQSVEAKTRQQIVHKLEQIIAAGNDYDLVSYATLQLIRRKLDLEFPILESLADHRTPVAQARKVKTFDAMGGEFALLLSLVVEASGATATQLDEQFKRVLKCYTQTSYSRRTANETGIIDELEAAFQTL